MKYGWLWVVVGGGSQILADRGLWQLNHGWSWVVMGGGGKIMAGHGCSWVDRGWSWMVARFSNAPNHSSTFRILSFVKNFLKIFLNL